MKWRYQPVYVEHEFGGETHRVYSLCEVHFRNDDRLESWVSEPAMIPQGDDVQELRNDITHMLADAYKWQPVAYRDLHVGMTFTRAVTQAQMNDIANMIDAINESCKAAANQVN